MEVSTLKELYSKVSSRVSTVYVVPLIRYSFPKTDYLYQLCKQFLEKPSETEIKSIGVFTHYKFVLDAIFRRNTILHYHWLEFQDLKSLSAMPYKLFCIWLYQLFGGNIIWTVHNVTPHDEKFLPLHLTIHKWMARMATLIHIHSKSSINRVCEYLDISSSKFIVLKLPRFPCTEILKQDALAKFLEFYGSGKKSLKTPVFLVFGGLSAYKGIEDIVTILTSSKKDFTLIIAGYVKKGQKPLHNFIVESTIHDARVHYVPAFIPEEHYPYLLGTADICVFNYRNILSSGGMAMALSCKKRVIAPNKGDLQELKNHDLVSLFETREGLSSLLSKELEQ